jgi:hypothetical protein
VNIASQKVYGAGTLELASKGGGAAPAQDAAAVKQGGGHVPEACKLVWAAGEYNLRLGITKELHPDMVATYQGMHSNCHAYQACEILRLCLDPMMQCS